MDNKISLYEVLDTLVTQVEKTCEDCGKTQSDFDLTLLDNAIPSNLDLPVIREIILQRKTKAQTSPHTQVLELLSSFPENTVHVVILPHIDPNAKLFIGKGNECESGTVMCLLINNIYAGSYTTTLEDAELYFNHRLCNFEALINMMESHEEDAFGELNLSRINNLPIKVLSGYIPLIVRKFMAPNNTYDNFDNTDYERFIKWAQTHLNHKLVYSEYPASHAVIAKTKGNKPDYYIAVKNGKQAYRTLHIILESDVPKVFELIARMLTDEDVELSLPNQLSFESSFSRTSDGTANDLKILLSNLDY